MVEARIREVAMNVKLVSPRQLTLHTPGRCSTTPLEPRLHTYGNEGAEVCYSSQDLSTLVHLTK